MHYTDMWLLLVIIQKHLRFSQNKHTHSAKNKLSSQAQLHALTAWQRSNKVLIDKWLEESMHTLTVLIY